MINKFQVKTPPRPSLFLRSVRRTHRKLPDLNKLRPLRMPPQMLRSPKTNSSPPTAEHRWSSEIRTTKATKLRQNETIRIMFEVALFFIPMLQHMTSGYPILRTIDTQIWAIRRVFFFYIFVVKLGEIFDWDAKAVSETVRHTLWQSCF